VLFGRNTYNDVNTNPSITAQTNGRIGINVVSPLQTLHVSGNTLINGGLTANTISATTITGVNYIGLPQDIYVTGGTNTTGATNNGSNHLIVV
jgi:hypothetical protein